MAHLLHLVQGAVRTIHFEIVEFHCGVDGSQMEASSKSRRNPEG